MSDHIIIDNDCPEIKLYEQYRKNDAANNFFSWIQTYWQEKYFDPLLSTFLPALSSCEGDTEYLQYFARYWYGILRPVDVTAALRYDEELTYDTGSVYDYRADAGVISLTYFRRMIAFIVNWSRHDWNIIELYNLVHEFTMAEYSDITIEQDDTDLDNFLITVPTSSASTLFKSLIQNYKEFWRLPFGITLEITLI